jgi:hypothetical protein
MDGKCDTMDRDKISQKVSTQLCSLPNSFDTFWFIWFSSAAPPNPTMSSVVPKKRVTTQIILNSVHWQPGTHRYRYNFPQPIDFSKNNAQVAISHYSFYNSVYNISSSLQNNTYQIVWVNGQTVTAVIPDGYYSFSEIDLHLEFTMSTQGWYLVSTTNSSQATFYLDITTNSVQYKAEIVSYCVPTTMPSGLQYPPNADWTLPVNRTYPQIILSPGLQRLFGMPNQSTFPLTQVPPIVNGSTVLVQSFLSTSYPVLSSVFALAIGLNLVNSGLSSNPTIIAQFPLTVSFGSLVTSTLQISTMFDICPGKYGFVEISIYDQNLSPLVLVDPELCVNLVLSWDSD